MAPYRAVHCNTALFNALNLSYFSPRFSSLFTTHPSLPYFSFLLSLTFLSSSYLLSPHPPAPLLLPSLHPLLPLSLSVEGLHFSNFDLGLLTLAGAVLSYFALVLYKNYLFDTSWRKVILVGSCIAFFLCVVAISISLFA
jgi:hypothetical protein